MKNLNLKFKLLIIPFIVFGVFFFVKDSLAANHYIRAGATGANNGTSWTDAWTSFGAISTANWIRGDTYYVAGGDYNEDVTIPSKAGTTWIIIKKANAADNGAEGDWNAAYANTQAVINGTFDIFSGYTEINGVTGSGESGHGIKIYTSTVSRVVIMNFPANAPVHLRHLEIKGAGVANISAQYGIYANSVGAANQKGLHISDCYLHEISVNGIVLGNTVGTSWADYGMLYENNVMSETGKCTSPELPHGQGLQISYMGANAYLIFRNNVFRNVNGSGMIVYLGGGTHRYSRIYNNVFYITNLDTYDTVSPGVIWTAGSAGTTADYFYIYNNTFYHIGDLSHTGAHGRIFLESTAVITEAELKNNIWVNSYIAYLGHLGLTAKSNNDYYNNVGSGVPTGETNQKTESADPFTNAAGYDFHLVNGKNANTGGLDLSFVFATDKDGVARTGWSIGAYEYVGGAPLPDTTPPSPPQNVAVI